MENFQKWTSKKDVTGNGITLLDMGVPFPALVNCACGYLQIHLDLTADFLLRDITTYRGWLES